MTRTKGSNFQSCLPVFKQHNLGYINWGLVSEKTQTIYPWGSKEGASEPEVWFHEIFRQDGTPHKREEIEFMKLL